MKKRLVRAAFALFAAALFLPVFSGCGNKPSGVYAEEGAEYPYSCLVEGNALSWRFCGEEEARTTFRLRKEGPLGYHPGLYRIVTDGMPFPDPCDDMLFWDRENDRLLLSLFASDGTVMESYLTRGREG